MHTSTLFRRVSRMIRKSIHSPTDMGKVLARANADDLLASYAAAHPGYTVVVADNAHPKHVRLNVTDETGVVYAADVHVLGHDTLITVNSTSGVSTNHVRRMLHAMDRL